MIIAPGLVLEYEVTPKLCLLLCLTAAVLLCWRAWLPGTPALFRTRHGRVFAGMLGIQLLSLLTSTAASGQVGLSLAGSPWRRYGLVAQFSLVLLSFAMAAYIAAHRKALTTILAGMAMASGLVSIYAVSQYFGWDPFLPRSLYTVNYNGEMLRVPATLGHAVYLGSFLCATIPIAVGLASRATGAKKLVLRLIAALSFAALLLSGSRSALVALIAGALITAWTLRKRRFLSVRFAAAACAALACALLIFPRLEAGASFRLRLVQWRQDALGGPRLLVWRDSLPLLAAHPLVGFGPETFGNEFRRRQSAELSRLYPDYIQESAHNLLLDGVFAQGFPYLLIVAGMVYLIFSANSAGAQPENVWFRASAAGVFVSFLFIPIAISGALMLYGLLAFIVASRNTMSPAAPGPAVRYAKPVAGGLAVILLAAAGAYLRQDMAYARIAKALKTSALGDMTDAYEVAAQAWFPQPGEDLWCSRQFATLARATQGALPARAWAAAEAASTRAEWAGDDRADADYQSGLLALGANNPTRAEQTLRQAIQDAPTWYKPRLLLAQLLRFTGRIAESQTEGQRALDLAGPMRANVEQALRE